MNKPKELKDEVKKFENAFRSLEMEEGISYNDTSVYVSRELNALADFYTQKFVPEMIEKYFEGWELEGRGSEGVFVNQNYGTLVWGFNNLHFLPVGETYFEMPHIFFQTLSDFIDACINSDIKLNWKSN